MPRSKLNRIRKKMRNLQYDMSAHAMEEMAEDALDIEDVERAVFTGKIVAMQKDDPRGTRYVIHGQAVDGKALIGVVGRFSSIDRYVIITVYQVRDSRE